MNKEVSFMGKIRIILYALIILAIYSLLYMLYPRLLFTSSYDYVNGLDAFFLGRNPFFTPFFILSIFLFIMFPVSYGVYFLASFGKIKYPQGSEDYHPKVSILMPALDEAGVIGASIESILNSNYPKENLELIIIASGSTDNTVEICRKYQDKVTMKILTKELSVAGKPAALNYGLEETSHEILAFYDADLKMESDTLHNLVRPLADEKVSAAIGPIRPTNWNKNWLTKSITLEYANHTGAGIFPEVRNRLGLSALLLGRNWCIRKEALNKVGKFDENCLTEDLNLAYRLIGQGLKIQLSPKAIIYETVPSTFKSFKQQRERWIGGYVQTVAEEKSAPKSAAIPSTVMITQFQPIVDFSLIMAIIALIFLFVFQQVFLFFWFIFVSIFIFGLVLNSIRKYGQGRYSLLLCYPYAIFLNTFMLTLQFKRGKTKEWQKTVLE